MDDSPRFVAGNLALDFHNTVSWNVANPFEDNVLHDYDAVVSWMVQAGVATVSFADELHALARANPESATKALDRVHELRTLIHEVFDAVARDARPQTLALDALNDWISSLPLRLKAEGDAYAWDWAGHTGEPASVVWPVVWSAATLLRSDHLARIGVCDADDCGWLFVDQSRRHNRKWCQMEVCGNRAKAQRHYHRKQRG